MKEIRLESKERAEVIARFAELAEARFAADPGTRSLLFAVAQYWNDSASDETHSYVVESQRDTPVWPHACEDYDDEGNRIEGERCSHCDWEGLRAPYIGIQAWEPFCYEHANQGMPSGEAYQPVAIARRGQGVEWIGRVQRPEHDHAMLSPVNDGDSDDRRWRNDARARELFAQLCASPDDDGPRAVLADYLLERRSNDPRGELIALSLSGRLDEQARERRAMLLASLGRRWFAPIEAMCAVDSIRYERGFVSRVDVHVSKANAPGPRTRSCIAWGTVRTLRYLPNSLDILDPAMVALRDVGIVGGDGFRALGQAPRPWAIERLHIDGGECRGPAFAHLLEALTLPALRRLVVGRVIDDSGDPDLGDAQLAVLFRAMWWPQLERITFAVPVTSEDALAVWARRHRDSGLPWLSVCDTGPTGDVAGVEIAFGPNAAVELSVVGPSARGTRGRLVELARAIAELDGTAVTLVSSAHRTFDQSDADFVRDHVGIEVVVRGAM